VYTCANKETNKTTSTDISERFPRVFSHQQSCSSCPNHDRVVNKVRKRQKRERQSFSLAGRLCCNWNDVSLITQHPPRWVELPGNTSTHRPTEELWRDFDLNARARFTHNALTRMETHVLLCTDADTNTRECVCVCVCVHVCSHTHTHTQVYEHHTDINFPGCDMFPTNGRGVISVMPFRGRMGAVRNAELHHPW